MERNLDRFLFSWLAFLPKVDKLNFKFYGLDFLFSLKGVQLDEIILSVIVRFCDFEFVVFRFSPTLKELWPIVEEFKELLGDPKRS